MSEVAIIHAEEAIERIANTANQLRFAREQLCTEWLPDLPPLTIVFSAFGRALCESASSMSGEELAHVCDVAEDLLVHGDDAVKDAVATGMFESVLAQSSSGKFELVTIAPFLGPKTKEYCRSWDAFTGVRSPGLEG